MGDSVGMEDLDSIQLELENLLSSVVATLKLEVLKKSVFRILIH